MKLRIYKLKWATACDNNNKLLFQQSYYMNTLGDTRTDLKLRLLDSCKDASGFTRGGQLHRRDTCWWNIDVTRVVKEKRRLWKARVEEEYCAAKCRAKSVSALLKRMHKNRSSATYT